MRQLLVVAGALELRHGLSQRRRALPQGAGPGLDTGRPRPGGGQRQPAAQGALLLRCHGAEDVLADRRVAEVAPGQQAGAGQRLDRPGGGPLRQPDQPGQVLQRLRPGGRRQRPGHLQHRRVQPVEAAEQVPAEGLARQQLFQGLPGPGVPGPLVLQHQRPQQQRVAAGGRVEAGRQAPGGVLAEPGGQQPGRAVGGEQTQPDPVVVRLPDQLGVEQRVRRHRELPLAEHHQHPGLPGPADQVEQALQRLRIRVLDVVDADDQRSLLGQRQQRARQAVQYGHREPSRRAVRVGVADPLGEQGADLGGGGRVQRRVLEQLDQQRQRQLALHRRADRAEVQGSGPRHLGGEAVQQLGAPGAHRSGQRDDSPLRVRAPAQGVPQSAELGSTLNQFHDNSSWRALPFGIPGTSRSFSGIVGTTPE